MICRESQLYQFVFDVIPMITLKKKLCALGGSSGPEPSLQLTGNVREACIRESLYYCDGFPKPSELQFDDDASFATIKLLHRVIANIVRLLHASSSDNTRPLRISGFLPHSQSPTCIALEEPATVPNPTGLLRFQSLLVNSTCD